MPNDFNQLRFFLGPLSPVNRVVTLFVNGAGGDHAFGPVSLVTRFSSITRTRTEDKS